MSILNNFTSYVKQAWANRPALTSPLSAARFNHMEAGIKANSDAIEQIANAVLSNIVNDPNKIASMAVAYSLQEQITKLNGDLGHKSTIRIDCFNTVGVEEYTISANSFMNIDTGIKVPEGYLYGLTTCRYTGNPVCTCVNSWIENGTVRVTMHNLSDSVRTLSGIIVDMLWYK